MTYAGYAADVVVIATYALLAFTGRARPFHWANAIGFVPVLYTEVAVGAYVAMVLTVFFGAMGWVGVLRRAEA